MKKTILIYATFVTFLFCTIGFAQKAGFHEIPIDIDSGQIIVKSSLNGINAKLVISNTMASSIDYTKYNKNNLLSNQKMYKNNLNNSYTPVAVVSGLKMGGLKLNQLDMYWDGAFKFKYPLSQRVDGILGYNFFKNRIVQINYQDKTLRVYKKNPYVDLLKNKNSTDKNISIVKLGKSVGLPPNEKSYTFSKNSFVNGKKFKLLINLNEKANLQVPLTHKILLDSNSKIQKLEIGTFSFENYQSKKVESLEKPKKYDGVLGQDFLRDYIVTFDYNRNKMILESVENNRH